MSKDLVFDKILPITLREEGGFVNNRRDPGGRTMYGVTQRTYDAYRHARGLAVQDVKIISQTELWDVYYTRYWKTSRCDLVSPVLALAVFDWAVNSGPVSAVEHLQGVLGVNQDGVVGPITIHKIGERDPKVLALQLCDVRERFFRAVGVGQMQVFLAGWLKRLERIRQAVKSWT